MESEFYLQARRVWDVRGIFVARLLYNCRRTPSVSRRGTSAGAPCQGDARKDPGFFASL